MPPADYYIENTDADGVPPNDWRDESPEHPREASAGAIPAAGMLQLSRALWDKDVFAAERYWAYASRIPNTLRSTEYIAADMPEWEGILRHATYRYRNELRVDESVMWGDYFLVEALFELEKNSARTADDV